MARPHPPAELTLAQADAPPAPPPAGEPAPAVEPPEEPGSAIEEVLAVDELRRIADEALFWVRTNLLTFDVALQLGLIVAALVPAAMFGPRLARLVETQIQARVPPGQFKRAAHALAVVSTPVALYVSLTICRIALGSAGQPTAWIDAALSLLTAWIVVRLITLVIRSPFWSQVAFYVIWPIAVLDALGILGNVTAQMRALAVPLGKDEAGNDVAISLFDVVRTLVYFAILFWGANFVGRFLETRIDKIEELTPSLRALIVKIMRVLLPIVAFLIALQIVGFNLATLAIFSGAVGLGIGLGLQRVIANFVAGFTLLADRSIKPGDVIEVNDTFGWVTEMKARYVAIRTRDGTEHLIPNDTLMSEGVINWSRSDRFIRLHAPFGVSYQTADLRAVQAMAVEAALAADRVVDSPKPICNLTGFGDSSVDFDLRFWITDPAGGLANVRSDVYLNLWDRLAAAGVEIPFPQRDLHVRSWDASARPQLGRSEGDAAP